MAESASLVVTLSATLSKFQKDMEQAVNIADKAIKDIEKEFNDANPDASGMMANFAQSAQAPAQSAGVTIGQALAVGIGAGVVGAVVSKLAAVTDALAKIGDQADELRLPVNMLQQLGVAADQAALPQDKLNKALQFFSDVSKKTQDDAEAFNKALSNIDPALVKAFANAPTQAARLQLIMNALASTTDEVKKAQLQLEAFGTDSFKIGQVFSQSTDEFSKGTDKLKELGLSIDENLVKKAQDARANMALLARVFTDDVSSALGGLIPILAQLYPGLQALGSVLRDLLAILARSEASKPIQSIDNDLSVLAKNLEKAQQEHDDLIKLESGEQPKPLRDYLRSLIDSVAGTDLTNTLENTQKDIDTAQKQLDDVAEVKRELARSQATSQQSRLGANAPAFQPRPPLVSDEETSFFERQTETIKRHIAALNADAAAVGLTAGAHQELRTELALLQASQRDGVEITDQQIDQYGRLRASGVSAADAMKQLGINLGANQSVMLDLAARMKLVATATDETQKHFKAVNDAAQFAGNQMIDIMTGLTQKTLTAAQAMQQLTNAIIKALLQAALLGQGPLAGILGFASKTQGGTGGLFGSLITSLGLGKVGAAAPGTTSPFGGLQIPTFASGGSVSGGKPIVVGEQGPELFVPDSPGQIVPNSVGRPTAAGGGMNVTVNNYTAPDSEVRQSRQQGPDGETLIIDVVKKNMARGVFDDTNRGRFGLRAAKVR